MQDRCKSGSIRMHGNRLVNNQQTDKLFVILAHAYLQRILSSIPLLFMSILTLSEKFSSAAKALDFGLVPS